MKRDGGAVCGVALPPGLVGASRLPEPVFTPATKAPRGEHDENISVADVAARAGADVAGQLERITLAVYRRGAAVAARAGLIVADTKIEFGFDPDGRLLLADEVLTPDSSRSWPADQWQTGPATALVRQADRPRLARLTGGRLAAARHRAATAARPCGRAGRASYIEAYERITGRRWE